MTDPAQTEPFDPIAALKALQERGVTFTHAVKVFGEAVDENPHARYALEHLYREGELEFDDTVVVSDSGDAGAYVMCWRWVDDHQAGVDRGEG